MVVFLWYTTILRLKATCVYCPFFSDCYTSSEISGIHYLLDVCFKTSKKMDLKFTRTNRTFLKATEMMTLMIEVQTSILSLKTTCIYCPSVLDWYTSSEISIFIMISVRFRFQKFLYNGSEIPKSKQNNS